MNMWAGSWLMASVVIERMKQISPATSAICGNNSQIFCASRAHLLELRLWPEADQLLALELRQLLALGHAFWHGLAVHLGQLGFPVERFQVRGPAGHRQPDDAFRLGRMIERVDDSPPLSLAGSADADWRSSNVPSATAPRPVAVPRQKGAARQQGRPDCWSSDVHGINSE